MPQLDRLPLRSSDLSFETEITGTLAASPGACSEPAMLYSSGVLHPGTQCCAVLSNDYGGSTGTGL
jgi:hypothetical protein